MATQSRSQDSDVVTERAKRRLRDDVRVEQVLQNDPWSFEFFQAVRLIERYSPGRASVGGFENPDREAVRFSSNPAMQFPPSQIASLDWIEGDLARMSVNFMGLMGQSGALPQPYSEYINDQIRSRDTALQTFLDIFNHRLISLFYQAWEKYRFQIGYERNQDDRLTHYLRDFLGLGTQGLKQRQVVRDESFLFYTGLLSLQPRSASALKNMLQDYFNIEVAVEQFVGEWHKLSENDQCQVGEGHIYSEQLGLGAVAGDEMWDIQSRARVTLGPMPLDRYIQFLPGGTGCAPLGALLKFFSNGDISFEVQLMLRREDVPAIQLGVDHAVPIMLSWTTWMKNRPFVRDPDETVFSLV